MVSSSTNSKSWENQEGVVDFTNFPEVPLLEVESSSMDVNGMERGVIPLPYLPPSLEENEETMEVETTGMAAERRALMW